MKNQRVICGDDIFSEAKIHPTGPNDDSHGLDLVWFPRSDDLSFPDTRLHNMRAGASASIKFRLEESNMWRYDVCGFVGYSSPTSGKKPTIEEAISTACAELASRVNEAWEGEHPKRVKKNEMKDKAKEAYEKALDLQRQRRGQ